MMPSLANKHLIYKMLISLSNLININNIYKLYYFLGSYDYRQWYVFSAGILEE